MASEDAPAPVPGTRAADEDGDGDRSDPRLVIARRELSSLKSEKTIVLAFAIQLFVATFSSFLVVGLVSMYDPSSEGGFTPTFAVTGNATGDVVRAAEESSPRAIGFESPDDARTAFRQGDADAVLVANWTGNGRVDVTAIVPEESIRTTLIVVETRRALETLERDLRTRNSAAGRLTTDPLSLPDETRSSPYFAFTYTVLVPLLLFLSVFISGSIAVDSLTEEIQRGTLELLRIAPVDLSDVIDGKVFAAAILAPAQAALWIAMLHLNGIAIVHWAALLVVIGAAATALVAGGVALSLLAPDRRQAQFLYSTGVILLGGVTLLLPENPGNVVAKLAVGSPTATTWASVVGLAAVALGSYAAIRVGVGRMDPETL